jgi:hypothetical protein
MLDQHNLVRPEQLLADYDGPERLHGRSASLSLFTLASAQFHFHDHSIQSPSHNAAMLPYHPTNNQRATNRPLQHG